MNSYKTARRAFLHGCGASAALLLPLLRSIEARAQGAPAPLRFLIIRHACGSPIDLWRPPDPATTTTFTLPQNTAAFAPLQSKMVLIDGVNIAYATTAIGSGDGGSSTVEAGTVELMTGAPSLGKIGQQDWCAGAKSIDQVFLDASPVLGGAGAPMSNRTPFGSLQLAADIRSHRDEVAPRVLSYRPPDLSADSINLQRKPMFPETQPMNTFAQLFGVVNPAGPAVSAAAANLLSQKRSVLDFMRRDLARLNTLIPADQKPKLAAFADAVDQVQAALVAAMPATGSACVVPGMPPLIPQNGKGASGFLGPSGGSMLTGCDYYVADDPNSHPHQVLGRLHLSMVKAAFLCDLVRVATFSWSAATSCVVFPGTFDGAILPGAPLSSPHYAPLQSSDAATSAWWAAIDRFYSDQTSQALQEFDTAIDIDGRSLLDNTVVVYASETSRNYDHNDYNIPFLVFGGANTRIRGGTFLKVTDGHLPAQTSATFNGSPAGNRPVNDAWLAIAPIFGVSLTALGNPTQYTGPLAGFVT